MDRINIRGTGEHGIHLRDTVTVAIEDDDGDLAAAVSSQTLNERRVVIDAVVDEHDFAPRSGFIVICGEYRGETIETERRRHRDIIDGREKRERVIISDVRGPIERIVNHRVA